MQARLLSEYSVMSRLLKACVYRQLQRLVQRDEKMQHRVREPFMEKIDSGR